ncbi:NAD-dependent protein deacetylase hst4 [Penicillium argentinense]|uniref:NAD-dependent protein deacetylase hst4 n=1 Tax=Penicillium argentinense TaxID=1131581 RepID=A0A9W9FEX0_9EURO|nr:NAD-dependent protein deacetylase hst4 [Penicillium argentinense]KAJ5098861.1 NAD-dependent protein deacetylase hst4 [Penicillium argentinense]
MSTPEPATRYLTPSSQDPEDLVQTREDWPPAKKRRRNPLPKERTTQHLSLARSSYEQKDQVRLLVETLRHQKDIVVVAGAGISTAAGIPDFRSTDGLFKSLQKKHNLKASGKLLFDAAVYQDDALTAPFHELVRSLKLESANCKPTKFHQMLARLGKEDRLKRLYTQNIDGLETSMPPLQTEIPLNVKGRWPVTIQLHGSITKMVCQKCRHTTELDPTMFTTAEPSDCSWCSDNDTARQSAGFRSHGVGRLRPRIVLYNEHNPDEEAITSVMNADVKSRPRVLVVAGTSLKIPGVRRLVKSLCAVIRSRKDGVTMFINNEPPVGKEFENCFDLIVEGSTEQVADMVHLKQWDDEEKYPMQLLPDPTFGKPSPSPVSVVINTPSKKRAHSETETGLLTPSSSQDEQSEPKFKATKSTKTGKRAQANPASRGPKIEDLLTKGTKAKAAPAKAVPAKTTASKPTTTRGRKPATTTAKKPRGKAATAPKNASITAFGSSTKSKPAPTAAAKMSADKIPLGDARNASAMFPNLVKDANAKLGATNIECAVPVPEVVS